jgi:hypothetical protein
MERERVRACYLDLGIKIKILLGMKWGETCIRESIICHGALVC